MTPAGSLHWGGRVILTALLLSASADAVEQRGGLYAEYHQGPLVPLVEDGQPRFIVVVSWAEVDLATTLLNYVERMTGVSAGMVAAWPPKLISAEDLTEIPIHIGSAAQPEKWSSDVRASMGEHGYRMRVTAEGIWIAGNSTVGTRNGVYAFLEKALGVRWFMSIPEGTYVPHHPGALAVGTFDKTESPALEGLGIGISSAIRSYLDWKDIQSHNRWLLANRVMGATYPTRHNYFDLIPPEKYWPDHPEYFALINETRDPYKNRNIGWQTCHANADLPRLIADQVIEYFRRNPSAYHREVSPNDGDVFCQCEPCQHLGTDTDQLLHMLNQVAQIVSKKYPDKHITFYAYMNVIDPPTPGVACHPMLVPNIAHYNPRSFHYGLPIGHPEAIKTAARDFEAIIRGWKAVCSKVAIREYGHLWAMGEWPYARPVAENTAYYSRHAVSVNYADCLGISSMGQLAWYLAAKKAWDPELATDELLADFFQKHYGPAAASMHEWFDIAEASAAKAPGAGALIYDHVDQRVLTPAVRKQMRQALETAMESAPQPPFQKRVLRAVTTPDVLDAVLELRERYKTLCENFSTSTFENLKQSYTKLKQILSTPDMRRVVPLGRLRIRELLRYDKSLAAGLEPQTRFETGSFHFRQSYLHGGMAQRDAQSYMGGWTPLTNGLGLKSGTSGELIYRFEAIGGVFNTAHMNLYWFNLGEARAEVSRDDGQSWTVVYENAPAAHKYVALTEHIADAQAFLLRFTGTNHTDSAHRFMYFLSLQGEVE